MLSRFLLWLFHVQVDFPRAARLRRHHGFVFPNHVSFLHVIVLAAVLPVRFLSKVEVRRLPLVGWIATPVGAVFVDRGSKQSRAAARKALATANHYPPVVFSPDGGILPPADAINPFRHGAFEVVKDGRISFLPLVLVYEPLAIVYWGDEPLWPAVWRVVAHSGPITVRVVALKTRQPDIDDTAVTLAAQTRSAMSDLLQHRRHGTKVPVDEL